VNVIRIRFLRAGRRFVFSLRTALVVLAFCLPTGLSYGAASSDHISAQLDEVVSHYERCGYFHGVVLVGQHGQIAYSRGCGEANRAKHVPNTTRTKFGIASHEAIHRRVGVAAGG
jgi:CubicO group peptidase (beta-lactamase class C family)